jgi:hypothetical protein
MGLPELEEWMIDLKIGMNQFASAQFTTARPAELEYHNGWGQQQQEQIGERKYVEGRRALRSDNCDMEVGACI